MEEVSLKEFLEQRLGNQDDTLARIEAQTTKTNGKVAELEKWRLENKQPLQDLIDTAKEQEKTRWQTAIKVIGILILCVLSLSGFGKTLEVIKLLFN